MTDLAAAALPARAAPATACTRATSSRRATPREPRAFWMRHTIHKRPGHDPIGSVWLTLFDATGRARQGEEGELPGAAGSRPTGLVRIARSRLRSRQAEGGVGGTRVGLHVRHRRARAAPPAVRVDVHEGAPEDEVADPVPGRALHRHARRLGPRRAGPASSATTGAPSTPSAGSTCTAATSTATTSTRGSSSSSGGSSSAPSRRPGSPTARFSSTESATGSAARSARARRRSTSTPTPPAS